MRFVMVVLAACVLTADIVEAAVLRVDAAATGAPVDGSSWDRAYRSPADALDAAQPGDELWVAAGIYAPAGSNGARTLSFRLKSGVSVYGGFPPGAESRGDRDPNTRRTVLTGDLNSNDGAGFSSRGENSCHVVTLAEGEALLDGFTISGGNADAGDDPPHDSGAGVNVTGGLLRLNRCIIEDNISFVRGGGICVVNGSIEIMSSRIQANESGGGGGVFIYGGGVTLNQCMVLDNTAGIGGGVYAASNAQLSATSTVFGRNEAALSGGAVYVASQCSAALLNCTLAGNRSSDGIDKGALLVWTSSTATVENCILYGNAPRSIHVYEDAFCTVTNSIVEGGYIGAGNRDVAPRFRLVDDPPYQLSWDSPAIDAGDASAPATDVLGATRPMNDGPDIGAYEFGTDTDGGGLPDDYENDNGLVAFDPADDTEDSDNDHLDNREEFRRGTNPQDENDPPSKFYVSPSGDDLTGNGSQAEPWKTIDHAMMSVPEGTALFPITIYLAAGAYDERVVFRPYTRIEGADAEATTIRYYQASDDEHVVLTAAEGCGLRSCTVTFPASVTATAELLRIDNVAMQVRNVVFNGGDSPHAIAVFVTRPGSTPSSIRNCTIKRVEYGVYAVDSGINVTRNTFESILEGAIFIRPPEGKTSGETPMLGNIASASTTGFNRFNMSSGFFIKNEAGDDVSAQYNDWGAYTDTDIGSRIVGGAGKAGSVTFKPYIGRSLVDASLVVAVQSQATNNPVESKYAPKAVIGAIAPARDLSSSLFIFPSIAGGTHLVEVSANSHAGQSRNVTVIPGDVVVETFMLTFTGGEGEGEGEGCFHAAGPVSPSSNSGGNGVAYLVLVGMLAAASVKSRMWKRRKRSV